MNVIVNLDEVDVLVGQGRQVLDPLHRQDQVVVLRFRELILTVKLGYDQCLDPDKDKIVQNQRKSRKIITKTNKNQEKSLQKSSKINEYSTKKS